MNSLLRNERPLYLCTRYLDENTGVTKFKEPIPIRINWQPKIENFDDMCEDADYEVSGDNIITLNDGEVLLKRLSRGEEYE